MKKRTMQILLAMTMLGTATLSVNASEVEGEMIQEALIQEEAPAEEMNEDLLVDEEPTDAPLPADSEITGEWIRNRTGWWYKRSDGTWPYSTIEEIDGVLYAFNDNGYMITGWHYYESNWYYFTPSGAMYSGWVLDKNIWYYLDGADEELPGRMAADCTKKINGKVYSFYPSGAMAVGWKENEEGWYYFDESGAMFTEWLKSKGLWYYLDAANETYPGLMAENGWGFIDEEWYYFNADGDMAIRWLETTEGTYYLGLDGGRKTGWIKIDNNWYYFHKEGAENPGLMAENGWEFIDEEWYYFYEDGKMAVKWLETTEGTYYLGLDGGRKTGWVNIDNSWYYFYKENDENGGTPGVMARNIQIDEWDILDSGIAVSNLQKKFEEIKSYVGTPYVYGGSTPAGWDCSGFTQWALRYLGVNIGRTAEAQFMGGTPVDMYDMSSWKPGDILIYISTSGEFNHAALYIGDGLIMHALNPNRGTIIQDAEYYDRVDLVNSLIGVRRYL